MSNPFAELSTSVSPAIMQTYVVVMILLVVGGTLFDIIHKRSAAYFFDHWRTTKKQGARQVGGGEMVSLGVQTAVEGLTSAEFCSARRRTAHLLTMYGFLLYIITTVILVFGYATPATSAPVIVTLLWYVGAIMVCVGGYWFWFFIRVDVASEGSSPFRLMRADLFVVSLVVSVTLGLIWAIVQWIGLTTLASVFLALYLIATTVLFGSIPWSKFSHMFFKPAAAFQRRVEDANGYRRNLPAPADAPAIYGSARQQPRSY